MKKLIIALVVIFLLILGVREWRQRKLPAVEPVEQGQSITSVDYRCDGDKTIRAVYFGDKVELNLSDKRNMLLIQGISASGTRYTNSDQSFTFWSKGNTAFIEEKDKTTFDNCTDSKANTGELSLTGKNWSWVKTELNDDKMVVPNKDGVFGIKFLEDGKLGISTDCNQMGANYKLNGNELKISSMMSNQMYCENSQEGEFANALGEVKSYMFDKDNNLVLELKNDSGVMIFE